MTTPPGYRLQELHLYNWGAFAGRHQAHLDAGNTAVIGPTGSGKTTLIDALMTLLCVNPRYNLASTGGHESDRDLVSYVRGASGPGHGGLDTEDRSDHLARTGPCVTGIAARLLRDNGHATESVLIGAILWFDGSSSSVADLGRRWCFAHGAGHSLDLWLEEHHGGGVRALGRLEKAVDGLNFYGSKSTYLARLQRFFEVGPNAFTLLNRAAGLKQLNSIDEIFRELVLDDHSAFDDALNVAGSFDKLAEIHGELEVANRQHLALLPLRELAAKEDSQRQRLEELHALHAALPHWFAVEGVRLWGEQHAKLSAALEVQQQEIDATNDGLKKKRQDEQNLLEIYLRSGGGDVKLLEESIDAQKALLARVTDNLGHYRKLVRNLGLTSPSELDAQALADQQQQAGPALQALDARQGQLQEATEQAVTAERNAHAKLRELRGELQAVRLRPGSNLPTEYTRFRSDLAEHLDLPEDDLPFVAELVEVQKKQQDWRGAIERALGSHRLRVLVPPRAMGEALRWVNQRHNRLHVRLLEVGQAASPARFLTDGFAHKLNLKPHPHQSALRQLLAELDLHCKDSAEALQSTPHAMTREGLMSGRAGQFDKQDQRRIDQDWMTGFDNRDRVAHLEAQIEALAGEWDVLDENKQAAQAQQATAAGQRLLWQQLQVLRFEDLDETGIQAGLNDRQMRLDILLDPESDAAQAKTRWEDTKRVNDRSDEALLRLRNEHASVQTQRDGAQGRQTDYTDRLVERPEGLVLPAAQIAELVGETLTCAQLDKQERSALGEADRQRNAQAKQLGELRHDILRQMAKAQKEDRGALAEQVQEVEALPHYLERLRTLEEEALPDKRQRFQEYLNSASDQGVSTLLSGIEAQVTEITERIDQLNQTLARVDFQSGRYLQLDPQPVLHPSLQDLHKAMAHLRSERLRDDDGRSHYQALQALVELLREHASNRRTKAAQALLDARYRLQFAVHVMDRASGQVLERRTGSQGGSGGEKEIIASYVLTASLSYALCPQGRSQPLFATIVLDEAFSKSSQTVAARIIQALHEFGLHALFVTPNKEMRLLRNHTRSAVVVHRVGRQSVLASLRWEELDAMASQWRDADRKAP